MKRKQKLLLSLVVVTIIFSIIAIQPFIASEEVVYEDVVHGGHSGVLERIEQRITDLETWENLWAEMESICFPVDPVPIINFSISVLFVVFQGERTTSGYRTTIMRIILTMSEYVVFVDEVHPGSEGIRLPVHTQPYHIVVVNSTQNLPVRFVYNITTSDYNS